MWRNRSLIYEVRDYQMRWRVGTHTQPLWCNCLVGAACPLQKSFKFVDNTNIFLVCLFQERDSSIFNPKNFIQLVFTMQVL